MCEGGGGGEGQARSLVALSGYEELPDPDRHPFDFPYNCSFRREDFVQDEDDVDASYDCILCLSVTKWVHFNEGDEGVKRLFRKVFDALAPGGCFVLEFQEWSSYKKKKSLTDTFKRNCAKIKLRPDMFQQHLLEVPPPALGAPSCSARRP
jgi:7SK snRNA methylphosphate capping enzyme